ncbi:MAG: hypothetical protein KDD34_06495 [Bdellovibrionales bacterium]|nr:hypothetical protein [Bdellovibrionales bacterium]
MKNLLKLNKMKALGVMALFAVMPISSIAATMKLSPIHGRVSAEDGIEVVKIVVGMDISYCSFGYCGIPNHLNFSPNKLIPTTLQQSQQSSDNQAETLFSMIEPATLTRYSGFFYEFDSCNVSVSVTAQDAEGTELQAFTSIARSTDPKICSDRIQMTKLVQDELNNNLLRVYFKYGKLWLLSDKYAPNF